jgi:hypothetical protein
VRLVVTTNFLRVLNGFIQHDAMDFYPDSVALPSPFFSCHVNDSLRSPLCVLSSSSLSPSAAQIIEASQSFKQQLGGHIETTPACDFARFTVEKKNGTTISCRLMFEKLGSSLPSVCVVREGEATESIGEDGDSQISFGNRDKAAEKLFASNALPEALRAVLENENI